MDIERDIQGAEGIAILGLIAVVGYFAYQIFQGLNGDNPDSTAAKIGQSLGINNKADNGQPQCTYADFSGGQCVDSTGGACGWWDYLTGYSCYRGKPLQNPIGTVPSDLGAGPAGGVTGSF